MFSVFLVIKVILTLLFVLYSINTVLHLCFYYNVLHCSEPEEFYPIKKMAISIAFGVALFFTNFEQAEASGIYLYEAVATWDAPVFETPNDKSTVLENLRTGEVVQVCSEIMHGEDQSPYKIIKYGDGYGYVPFFSVNRTESIYESKFVSASNIQNPYEFVSIEGNIREGSFKDLMRSYIILPEYIRSMFQREGYILRMTEQDVQYESFGPQGYTGETMYACFDYEVKKLFVNDENARHIVHEMGHFVNDRLGMFSSRKENKAVYNSEKGKLTMYAATSPSEFYAECFDMYFRCNYLLRVQSPSACEMVERSLAEFRNLASTKLPAELLR